MPITAQSSLAYLDSDIHTRRLLNRARSHLHLLSTTMMLKQTYLLAISAALVAALPARIAALPARIASLSHWQRSTPAPQECGTVNDCYSDPQYVRRAMLDQYETSLLTLTAAIREYRTSATPPCRTKG